MKQLFLVFVAILAFSTLDSSAADIDLTEQHVLRGRVTDYRNQPVKGAKVLLKTLMSRTLQAASTDRQGEFEISHRSEGVNMLEIVPPKNTNLASAFIHGIPGDQTRQFSVQLQHGFIVTGRVVHQGKGLKGLTVKVLPQAQGEPVDSVHGSGLACTGADGRFHLVLTPGPKELVVLNQRFPELTPDATQQFTVVADKMLPDIDLPKCQKQGG